jgi:hypothetical protein
LLSRGGAGGDDLAFANNDVTVANVTNVAAISSGGITAASIATGAIDADALATDAVSEIADGVWDEAISGHLGAGSTGAALNAAGSAGDPWTTPLPGAYGTGTAGKIIGDNINATISSRSTLDATGIRTAVGLASANLDTQLSTIDTVVDSILDDTGTNGVVIATGAITAASIATGAIDADALATDAVTEIADGLLDRDMSIGTDSGSATVRTPRQALRFLRNKWALSAGTLTVYKEDDTTSSWAGPVTTDAAADPITGLDPASS